MSKTDRSRPRIVAIAGDPGGAAALAPVVSVLMNSSQYEVAPCAYAQASSLWQSLGLTPGPVDALPERLAAADFLLTATSVNDRNVEQQALVLARNQGIPSLTLLDFWSNYRLRFTNAKGQWVLPDRIAIMDELARTEMVAEGFPPERLVVTGQPAFDRLALARHAFTPQRRQTLRSEMGVGETGYLVLFISQPFADIYGSQMAARATLGFDEYDVLEHCVQVLSQLARQHRIALTLAIRPHPRESADKFKKIQEGSFRTVICNTPDQLEAALSADLILGMNSVLLHEATLMGCPVVSVQLGLKIADPLPSNRNGKGVAVYDTTKLGTTLEKTLFGPDRRNGVGLSSDISPIAGNAAAAVIQEIGTLLGQARP